MAAQPTGPPARWRRGFANANLPHPDLDFRGKSLQTLSVDLRRSRAPGGGRPSSCQDRPLGEIVRVSALRRSRDDG